MAEGRSSDMFSGRMFALVTGGSQGLGRSIAVGLAAKTSSGSVIAITARSKEGLEKTAELARAKRREYVLTDDIEIICVTSDLSNSKDIDCLVQSCVGERHCSHFSSALLVHNMGCLGDISKEVCDFQDSNEVADYYKLNLAHIPPITGKFLKWADVDNGKIRTVVVNISSLAAIKPFPCWGLYASGKAARDMLFQVLATENTRIKVLNYAPGPLYTAMSETILSTPNKHNTDRYMRSLRDDGKCLTCEQSTAKLFQILQRDDYASGSHVDYYD